MSPFGIKEVGAISQIYGNYQYSSYMMQRYGPSAATIAKYNVHKTYENPLPSMSGYSYAPLSATDKETQAAVSGIKSAADSLKTSLGTLAQQSSSVRYTAVSSNTEALDVSQKPTSSYMSSQFKDVKINVAQAAAAQRNAGVAITKEETGVEAGRYSFAVDTLGEDSAKTANYTIDVAQTDSAFAIQTKMADAINADKNSGVRAAVQSDSLSGKSRLILEAKEPGTAKDGQDAFAVRDTASPGERGLAAIMGVDKNDSEGSVKAQNAVYSINGGQERTSRSNTIELSYGVSVNIKGPTNGAATVSMKPDTSDVAKAAKNFVLDYNRLVDTAKSNGAQSKLNALQAPIKSYARALSAVGIEQSSDGTLTLDEGKLNKAIESGALQSLFSSGGNYGMGAQLQKAASSLVSNPMQLMSKSSSVAPFSYNKSGGWDTGLMDLLFSSMYSGQFVNALF